MSLVFELRLVVCENADRNSDVKIAIRNDVAGTVIYWIITILK